MEAGSRQLSPAGPGRSRLQAAARAHPAAAAAAPQLGQGLGSRGSQACGTGAPGPAAAPARGGRSSPCCSEPGPAASSWTQKPPAGGKTRSWAPAQPVVPRPWTALEIHPQSSVQDQGPSTLLIILENPGPEPQSHSSSSSPDAEPSPSNCNLAAKAAAPAS
nr:skin secretory protein xP2-like isoform X1 [Caretta caretta]